MIVYLSHWDWNLYKSRKDIVLNLDELNIKLRTITLPSDRTAKNFYEANGITARVLLMEEKRDKSRNRS